mmetsp:Transcript_4112/g.9856  ORF Transcript_4112/g.9856 Transcript_4112/m.9856 type:complete len:1132 (+) Transcript_4112:26-3421(+)
MEEVNDKVSFPEEENKILEYWDEIKAFETSVKKSEGRPVFTFYDGPPFATGMPHYGHILAGTIKDTVTRFAHQTGHYVERRWGWDCHGLPVEYEIEQSLGIKGRDDILAMGIDKYNAECRAIVMRYSHDWKRVVRRLARWIDMENDYKTLQPSYMESVWWVFNELFKKGLVYRGFKVMPYSTACGTGLSNFEANLNYKEVSDPSVTVTLPLVDEPEVQFLAWTTTPWTLPSNLGLCVNPNMDYARFREVASGKVYIAAVSRIPTLYKKPEEYEILKTMKGTELAGIKYIPLFPYFKELGERENGAFRVLVDDYVTEDSGTGVVHQAPAFGEDDLRVCLKAGVVRKGEQPACPIDANGRFTDQVGEFAGLYIKDADKKIQADLKKRERLFSAGSIVHSYPFCWRSETPLIYRTIPSWFVKVEEIKAKIIECNTQTSWVPAFVQEKRFANWLADARDWAVSRDRFWGTPMPLWCSEDFEEVVCIGSVEQLFELSGVRVEDLHRESIDHITIPSKQGKGVLKRVEQVFDCWFESGSMPYAQQHYPFENKEKFEGGFPADFIAEGLDQTRGWFYTLMVLSTALFDKPAFKNLICNGLVLAEDGKKMSKRLKNYPDPEVVVSEHGADALRLYLINSPAVRAEPLKFSEAGVKQVVKDVFLPWYNAYRFFYQAVMRYQKATGTQFVSIGKDHFVASSNIFDQWVQASCASLLQFVTAEMHAYKLYTVVPRLVRFIEELTNWYVRLNRSRLKGEGGPEDAVTAISVLFEVLLTLSKAMGPFTPFFAELLYRNLRRLLPEGGEDSVHYCMFPEPSLNAMDPRMETKIARMQKVILQGRLVRDKVNVPLRVPLPWVEIIHSDSEYLADINECRAYIESELNVREVRTRVDAGGVVKLSAVADMKLLGQRLGKAVKGLPALIKALDDETLRAALKDGFLQVGEHKLTTDEVKIGRELAVAPEKGVRTESYEEVLLLVNTEVPPELAADGIVRDLNGRVMKLRKKAGMNVLDKVEIFLGSPCKQLHTIVSERQDILREGNGAVLPIEHLPSYASIVIREKDKMRVGAKDEAVEIVIARAQLHAPTAPQNVQTALAQLDLATTLSTIEANGGKLVVEAIELSLGVDLFASVEDALAKGGAAAQ